MIALIPNIRKNVVGVDWGSIGDGQFLKRVGNEVVGADAGGGDFLPLAGGTLTGQFKSTHIGHASDASLGAMIFGKAASSPLTNNDFLRLEPTGSTTANFRVDKDGEISSAVGLTGTTGLTYKTQLSYQAHWFRCSAGGGVNFFVGGNDSIGGGASAGTDALNGWSVQATGQLAWSVDSYAGGRNGWRAGLASSAVAVVKTTDGGAGYGTHDALAYRVSGTKVVGAQGAAIADATNGTDVITQLNTLLAHFRTWGTIAT